MKKSLILFANVPGLFIILLLGGCHSPSSQSLTIATAASMQFPIRAVIRDFESNTGIRCNMVVASSGKLTAQIIAGAPYDVFISANMKYPEEIDEKDKAVLPPQIYASGELVLWTLSDKLVPSFDSLLSDKYRHIAIANPKIAPYGAAALAALKRKNLYGGVRGKLVYGESISQVNQFVISGTATVGFTAKSVVLSPKMKDKGHWVAVDPGIYPRIDQGVVVLKSNPGKEREALLFMEFLLKKKHEK